MALHPNFPQSPYEVLQPAERWFPAAEELRATAYEKLVPPLVARLYEWVARCHEGGEKMKARLCRAYLVHLSAC